MSGSYQIIAVNPGSVSTKVAVFDSDRMRFSVNVPHPVEELLRFPETADQLEYRKETILAALREHDVNMRKTDAFSGRCTGLLPMPNGIYEVNDLMCEHGRMGIGSKHPGNLGPMIVRDFAIEFGGRSLVVYPSSIDEFTDKARLTGFVDILRTSRGHPLNHKEVSMRFAKDIGRKYEDINLVVVHMGGGISVAAHQHGRMVDVADGSRGEGRMAPTRSGALPAASLVELCFSGRYTEKELLDKIMKKGGWTDLLGTADALDVEKRINEGDEFAKLVYETTAYQIAKDVGAYAAVLSGDVQGILLTGGIAYSKYMVSMITEMVSFIAPVYVYPGEFEMEGLANGALRVLVGKEVPVNYTGESVFKGFPGHPIL